MIEYFSNISGQQATWAILVALIFLFILFGIRRINEGRAKIVERLGRRHKVIRPGLNIIIPVIDRVKNSDFVLETTVKGQRVTLVHPDGISIAEQRMDPPSKQLLAKDNSQVNVDPIVYFRIIDPIKVVYDVIDFAGSFETLIETTLRQEVGKYDGDTIVTSRETLSDSLKLVLQQAASDWGITILRVEIEELSFDEEVTKSLSDARQEELKRRAELVGKKAEAEQLVVIAKAKKEAQILEGEGIKQKTILEAEGVYEQKKLEAEAAFLFQSREQEGIAQGFAATISALKDDPDAIVALEALKAQAKVAESLGKSSSSLIVPAETAGLFGAIGSIVKGLDIVRGGGTPRSESKNISSDKILQTGEE